MRAPALGVRLFLPSFLFVFLLSPLDPWPFSCSQSVAACGVKRIGDSLASFLLLCCLRRTMALRQKDEVTDCKKGVAGQVVLAMKNIIYKSEHKKSEWVLLFFYLAMLLSNAFLSETKKEQRPALSFFRSLHLPISSRLRTNLKSVQEVALGVGGLGGGGSRLLGVSRLLGGSRLLGVSGLLGVSRLLGVDGLLGEDRLLGLRGGLLSRLGGLGLGLVGGLGGLGERLGRLGGLLGAQDAQGVADIQVGAVTAELLVPLQQVGEGGLVVSGTISFFL